MSRLAGARGIGGRVGGIVFMVVALGGAAVVAAPHADAIVVPHGRVIAKPCLSLQSDTTTTSTKLGCIPYNTTIAIPCTDGGVEVRGPFGVSRIWDRTTYAGKTGYVTDAYVDTGTNNPVAASCLGKGKGRVVRSPCLRLRVSPSVTSPSPGCVPFLTAVTITCTKLGDPVLGPWGTTKLWDHTSSGYLPDAWVYTATAAAVAPPC